MWVPFFSRSIKNHWDYDRGLTERLKQHSPKPREGDEGYPLVELVKEIQMESEGTMYQRADELLKLGAEAHEIAREARDYEYGGVPAELMDTTRSIFRAHYYLELARRMDLPLAPHPTRAAYYETLAEGWIGVPESIVSEFDQKMSKSQSSESGRELRGRPTQLTVDHRSLGVVAMPTREIQVPDTPCSVRAPRTQ